METLTQTNPSDNNVALASDLVGQVLNDRGAGSFFDAEWPEMVRMSFGDACKAFELTTEWETIQSRLEYLRKVETTKTPPIVAIVGGKNAGKSSFVSGFLSEHGRQRLLRGEGAREGTQRFVLWLPENFRNDDEIRQGVDEVLEQAFGRLPEELPEEAAAAHAVYADREKVDTPVIAFDAELNSLGFCFLDTPDFQTSLRINDTAPSAHLRFEWIKKSARFIQGIVFVVSRSDVGNEVFMLPEIFLSKELKGFPRFLCLNKITRPHPTLREDEDVVAAAERFSAKKVYGAFNFDIRHSETWLPSTPEAEYLTARQAPVFFNLECREYGEHRRIQL